MLENQRNLMIMSKTQSFTPNEFYCCSYVLLFYCFSYVLLFYCFSHILFIWVLLLEKLEERDMLEIGFATSLFCFINYLVLITLVAGKPQQSNVENSSSSETFWAVDMCCSWSKYILLVNKHWFSFWGHNKLVNTIRELY